MATAREIVRRALMRARVLAAGEEAAAADASDALAILNDLRANWPAQGLNVPFEAWTLDSDVYFLVPAKVNMAATIDNWTLKGTWNASTNSPALASGTGTAGDVYRVATAGATTLDGVTPWAVGDFAIFDADTSTWVRGESSRQFEGTLVSLLALRLCTEYGKAPPDLLAMEALGGWSTMLAKYVRPGKAVFDVGIVRTPSRGMVEFI